MIARLSVLKVRNMNELFRCAVVSPNGLDIKTGPKPEQFTYSNVFLLVQSRVNRPAKKGPAL